MSLILKKLSEPRNGTDMTVGFALLHGITPS